MPAPVGVFIAFGSGFSFWDETWPIGPALARIGPPARTAMENEVVRFACDDSTPYGRFFMDSGLRYVESSDPEAKVIELFGRLMFDELNGTPIREFAIFEGATVTPGSGTLIYYEVLPKIQKEEQIAYFHKVRLVYDTRYTYWPVYESFEEMLLGGTPANQDARWFQTGGGTLGGNIMFPTMHSGMQGERAAQIRSPDRLVALGLSPTLVQDNIVRKLDPALVVRPDDQIFFEFDFFVPISWDISGADPLFPDGFLVSLINASTNVGYFLFFDPSKGIFIDSGDLAKVIPFPQRGAWHRIRAELKYSTQAVTVILDGVTYFTAASVQGLDLDVFSPLVFTAPNVWYATCLQSGDPAYAGLHESWTAQIDNVIVDTW